MHLLISNFNCRFTLHCCSIPPTCLFLPVKLISRLSQQQEINVTCSQRIVVKPHFTFLATSIEQYSYLFYTAAKYDCKLLATPTQIMDSPITSAEAADASEFPPLFPDELWYEVLLRYGLYVGAAFQLVCILAVIVLPPIKEGSDSSAGVCKIFYHKCNH